MIYGKKRKNVFPLLIVLALVSIVALPHITITFRPPIESTVAADSNPDPNPIDVKVEGNALHIYVHVAPIPTSITTTTATNPVSNTFSESKIRRISRDTIMNAKWSYAMAHHICGDWTKLLTAIDLQNSNEITEITNPCCMWFYDLKRDKYFLIPAHTAIFLMPGEIYVLESPRIEIIRTIPIEKDAETTCINLVMKLQSLHSFKQSCYITPWKHIHTFFKDPILFN